ncbi:MAG: Lrp/AsnC family transcriptional regulator [candidate division Zixibacteria bacterium]
MDAVDCKILNFLQVSGRMPASAIAREIGMAVSAVGERMRKMEERGIICGYEARVNGDALQLSLTAFIYVRTDEPAASEETAAELTQIPQVLEVHNIAGEDCYLIKVRVKDAPALSQLLRDPIGKIKTVISTRSTIVMETYKETSRLPLPTPDK